jgi:hypothetical protein
MTVEPASVLERIALTLRRDIGPSVEDPFAKTQTFMASVILTKLAGQLRLASADAHAAGEEHAAVARSARLILGADAPVGLAAAVDALESDGATARWNDLVVAIYGARANLDPDVFDRVLGVVRAALRARLDRALEYAR